MSRIYRPWPAVYVTVKCQHAVYSAVETHSCVDIVAKLTDEQYTTINQTTAKHFDPRVFVNCCILHTCKQLPKTLWSKCPAVD